MSIIKEEQTHVTVTHIGPLLVLACLALRHRNTLMERMRIRRDAAAAEVINMRRPLLDSYQGASSAGQISQS